MVRPNHNVHVSINRRIEMPPAFHFPEDQIPPSDLVGLNNHDSPDNAQAVSGAYRLVEFCNLGQATDYGRMMNKSQMLYRPKPCPRLF